MDMTLKRNVEKTEDYTVGTFSIPNKFTCFTIEDAIRDEKIKGHTCIPAGRYEVIITWSPRFERRLPILLSVPNFEGIRMHSGNTADHTEGCILPNLIYVGEGVGSISKQAEEIVITLIDNAIKKGEKVFIDITND
jgi:hypothetical protein